MGYLRRTMVTSYQFQFFHKSSTYQDKLVRLNVWVSTVGVCQIDQASCWFLFVSFWCCLGVHARNSRVFMVLQVCPDYSVPS